MTFRRIHALLIIGIMAGLLGIFVYYKGFSNQKVYQPAKIKRPAVFKNADVQELVALGDFAYASGDHEGALAAYRKAAEKEPKTQAVYEKIGTIHLEQKNYEAAKNNLQLARDLQPQPSSQLAVKLVKTFLGLRAIFDARDAAQKLTPQTQEWLYYNGIIAAILNEQEKAKDYLKQSTETGTDEKLKAYAHKLLDSYRDFELARGADLLYLQALLTKTFDATTQYGLAIELGFNALKKEPNYRDVWIVMGHAFLNEKKYADAEDALTKAIDLDSTSAASYFFRGLSRTYLGKVKEAIDDLEKARSLGWQPKIILAYELAELYFREKNFTAAFPLYKEVVTTDPSDINRFIRPLALAINHLKKEDEALVLARLAFEKHGEKAMAYNLLGWAFLSQNKFEEAHHYLQQARARDPELDYVYLNLGQLYERQGKYAEALENYQKALELAQRSNNSSVGESAAIRYNETATKKTVRSIPFIPSLSLE